MLCIIWVVLKENLFEPKPSIIRPSACLPLDCMNRHLNNFNVDMHRSLDFNVDILNGCLDLWIWIEKETGDQNFQHGLKLHSALVGRSDGGVDGWIGGLAVPQNLIAGENRLRHNT